MKTRLQELLQRASVAEPPETLSRSTWTPYLPIIRVLMEERSYTLTAAVEWLVVQGEIEKPRQGLAYRALRQLLARREAKKQRQQIRLQRQFHALVPPLPSAPAGPAGAPPAAAELAPPSLAENSTLPPTGSQPETESPLLFPL